MHAARRLILVGALALVLVRSAWADDVVPEKAVQVAEAWWSLVDRGRYEEAISRYFVAEAGRTARGDVAGSLAPEWGKRPAKVDHRTIIAWLETPDNHFVMRFETLFTSGRFRTDELRMVKQGEDSWRILALVGKLSRR